MLCDISTAVVGCANPTMQPGMKMTRNGDVITISCDVTSATASHDDSVWQMTCVRNHWVGSYGNCDASRCIFVVTFNILNYTGFH